VVEFFDVAAVGKQQRRRQLIGPSDGRSSRLAATHARTEVSQSVGKAAPREAVSSRASMLYDVTMYKPAHCTPHRAPRTFSLLNTAINTSTNQRLFCVAIKPLAASYGSPTVPRRPDVSEVSGEDGVGSRGGDHVRP